MVLIDCLYINNGGGKILLDQLISEINLRKLNVQFLLDRRLQNIYNPNLFSIPPIYLKANILNRLLFYLNLKNKYNIIFTFANIPPPISLKIKSYTYLHNISYLNVNINQMLSFNLLKLNLKKFYIKLLKNHTNFWVVQTELVKSNLSEKWNINSNDILVLPFFNKVSENNIYSQKKFFKPLKINYLYVSNGEPYKNHYNLLKAFEIFALNKFDVLLKVTIEKNYTNVLDHINALKEKNLNIINLGILCNEDIHKEYLNNHTIVIYPSLYESFGLGLIEASQYNLPILASNRQYVAEIIEPSLSFDPLSVESIIEALEFSYTKELKPSKLIINNEIDKILNLLN